MSGGRTADARLERLLHVLPAASRDGGAPLAELAAALDTTEQVLVADLEEVTARVFYHPGGWPDDLQILVEPDRVRVLHAGGLTRPVRLNARETLCLALALRGGIASSHVGDPEVRRALLRRAEAHLGRGLGDDPDDAPHPFVVTDDAPDEGEHRETLMRAARDRTPCAILYLKPGAPDVDVRVIHPYALVAAEGTWYVVAHCCTRDGIRLFRVDRVLEAAPADGTFDVPDDFDVDDYVDDGRVYHADDETEVRIRYSKRVARWLRERTALGVGPLADEADGAVVARHRVADPHWAVGHVLQYGADAEVLGPEALRAMVREVAGRLAG